MDQALVPQALHWPSPLLHPRRQLPDLTALQQVYPDCCGFLPWGVKEREGGIKVVFTLEVGGDYIPCLCKAEFQKIFLFLLIFCHHSRLKVFHPQHLLFSVTLPDPCLLPTRWSHPSGPSPLFRILRPWRPHRTEGDIDWHTVNLDGGGSEEEAEREREREGRWYLLFVQSSGCQR